MREDGAARRPRTAGRGAVRAALTAGGIGLAAALVALAALAAGGPRLESLDWLAYDRWVRARAEAPSAGVVVAARDAASEARLGAGPWDRAVLARAIGSLSRAGAAAVGIDAAIERPSVPARGGAASDALLGEAVALAGDVVFPLALELAPGSAASLVHPSWIAIDRATPEWPAARFAGGALPAFAEGARALGHALAPPEPDGVVRRIPLFVRVGDRAVPALGLALAVAAADAGPGAARVGGDAVAIARSGASPAHIPVDSRGRALLAFASPPPSISFLQLWTRVEEGRIDALRELVEGKIVVLLTEPAAPRLTPGGALSDAEIQVDLLLSALGGTWVRSLTSVWALVIAFALGTLAALVWLRLRWWRALIAAGLLFAVYAGCAAGAPSAGLLLPVWLPLSSIVLASAGALVANYFRSTDRIRDLQHEVEQIREALVGQESAVEGLEEDLDAARAAFARSTGAEGALRAQLDEARATEQGTRARLEEVERQVRALRPAESPAAAAGEGEAERLRSECFRVGILTRSPAMLALFADLEKAARSPLAILILGEPGTGKELFARAAHRLSARAAHPFVAVNMAAISPELFESELFGHVRGSFTGAVAERKGYFEQADRGTLFLDEVGELRPEHQSKLLRALQEKSFYRIGATRPTAVDVRVVAASNRDLERGAAEGWFREDLYFRLKGFVIELPPLSQRPEDLHLLATRFAEEAAAEMKRPGLALSQAALAALESHDWPGNVRELQHCLRQAAALAKGPVIAVEDLRLPGPAPRREETDGDAAVLAALRRHGFDMQVTARTLGWDRSTVTQRLKGLGFRALVDAGGDTEKAALDLAGSPALARAVELKLREYHDHLLRTVQEFDSADAAVAACRRRFKNLPERHFRSLEALVRQRFEGSQPPPPSP